MSADRSRGTVQVEGLRELRKELKAAGDDLSDLKDVNKRAASLVAHKAAPLAPTQSGKLAASIRPAGTQTAAVVRAGKKDVPYANMIHWGRKIWPSIPSPPPQRGKFPALVIGRAFLSDAAEDTQPEWLDLYSSEIDKILDTVNGKN